MSPAGSSQRPTANSSAAYAGSNAGRVHRRPRGAHAGTRLLVILAALFLGLLATAGPASAHNVLISSDPADGATLDTAPARVSFTFDQPIQDFDPVLEVIGPNGNTFTDGTPTIDGSVIWAPMLAGPAGSYRAVYRVVSADGHPASGQISFTLTAGAAGTATGHPADMADMAGPNSNGSASKHDSGSSAGLSLWMWVGIGIAVVLVAVAAAIALRRPPDNQRPGEHEQSAPADPADPEPRDTPTS